MTSPAGHPAVKSDTSSGDGVPSTTLSLAGSCGPTSIRVCSGQTAVNASPTKVIAPKRLSGTETSVEPVWHSICDSACAAKTSGGIGGVQADAVAATDSANAERAMPRPRRGSSIALSR